jgi:hypothetical protein
MTVASSCRSSRPHRIALRQSSIAAGASGFEAARAIQDLAKDIATRRFGSGVAPPSAAQTSG